MVQDFLSAQGLRVDGRRHNELRHIQCKLGVLGRFVNNLLNKFTEKKSK